jgi:excisionase family DNA binding protein
MSSPDFSSSSARLGAGGTEQFAYSTDEAAQSLGVSRPTIYKLLAEGQLASFTIGRRRLIARSELERLVSGEVA